MYFNLKFVSDDIALKSLKDFWSENWMKWNLWRLIKRFKETSTVKDQQTSKWVYWHILDNCRNTFKGRWSLCMFWIRSFGTECAQTGKY